MRVDVATSWSVDLLFVYRFERLDANIECRPSVPVPRDRQYTDDSLRRSSALRLRVLICLVEFLSFADSDLVLIAVGDARCKMHDWVIVILSECEIGNTCKIWGKGGHWCS